MTLTPEQQERLQFQLGKLFYHVHKVFVFGYLTFYIDRSSFTFRWTVTRKGFPKFVQEQTFHFIDLQLKDLNPQTIVNGLFTAWFNELPEQLKAPLKPSPKYTPIKKEE
jgi:hypothetical protein